MKEMDSMSKKIKIQVNEKYARNVFVTVELNENQTEEQLNEILDNLECSSASYETLLCELNKQDIKVTHCDNNSLFDFQENNFVDYREVDEIEE